MCGISGLLELSSFQDPNTLKLVDYDIDICNDVAASFGVKPEYKIVAEAAHTFDALFGVGIAKDSPSLKEAINGTLLELEQTGKRNETWDGRVGKDSSYKLERTCKVVPVDGG